MWVLLSFVEDGFSLVWLGLVGFGLVWFGLVWFDLVWFGSVWFGLGWGDLGGWVGWRGLVVGVGGMVGLVRVVEDVVVMKPVFSIFMAMLK